MPGTENIIRGNCDTWKHGTGTAVEKRRQYVGCWWAQQWDYVLVFEFMLYPERIVNCSVLYQGTCNVQIDTLFSSFFAQPSRSVRTKLAIIRVLWTCISDYRLQQRAATLPIDYVRARCSVFRVRDYLYTHSVPAW